MPHTSENDKRIEQVPGRSSFLTRSFSYCRCGDLETQKKEVVFRLNVYREEDSTDDDTEDKNKELVQWKMTCCSCIRPEFVPSTHMPAHDHLQLQVQGFQALPLHRQQHSHNALTNMQANRQAHT